MKRLTPLCSLAALALAAWALLSPCRLPAPVTRPAAAALAVAALPAGAVVPDGLVADANFDASDTDNAPQIQAALDTGRPVLLPPGVYWVKSTLTIRDAVGRSLEGTYGGRLGPNDITAGTWLVWGGAPGGTMVDVRGVKCRLRSLGLACGRATSLACAVDLETPDQYPNVSSQHRFEDLNFYGMAGPLKVGCLVGADQRGNNEFHWWKSCLFTYCTYAGVHVPNGTFQCKNLVCEDCTFGGSGGFADYGVAVATGSFDFWRCNFNSLGCAAAWFGGSYEPVDFVNCTGESNRRFCQASGLLYLNLLGCRLNLIAAPDPQPAGQEFISGGRNWNITGSVFEEADTLVGFLRPGNSGTATLSGVEFHSKTPFPADDNTTFNVVCNNVRVETGNDLLPSGGNFYQANGFGLTNAGRGLLLWDGHWPLKGAYDGGTYKPAPAEAKLFLDSGKLWLQVGANAPQALQLAP